VHDGELRLAVFPCASRDSSRLNCLPILFDS
jgi:hypothetical protein